ncbi:uncharacterized protein LOC130645973 [Hydractinia symbiolongicarpus]|uniref:uncharacterized protein LOC130645973 n=1 Tax=Hydractinia symbiolongicarpus TaxID=13093 RepID=UPI00254F1C98|nr:uncharacterized protein LOC130645973 [Hydractinia symbiolongicarpus]
MAKVKKSKATRSAKQAVANIVKEEDAEKSSSICYNPEHIWFDLLYMRHDKVYGNTYKYILMGIDVASKYKVARPLRTEKASEVADMIKDVYKKGPLRYPETFQCDNGSEFKSDVAKLLEGKGVEIKQATTKYHHTFTAFVESYNKVLAERLFNPQDA